MEDAAADGAKSADASSSGAGDSGAPGSQPDAATTQDAEAGGPTDASDDASYPSDASDGAPPDAGPNPSGCSLATVPTPIALPPGYPPDSFTSTGRPTAGCGTTGIPAWTMLDLTHDGRPDIVVTRSCTDANVSVTKWLVYAAGTKGFAQEPAEYTLPAGYPGTPFVASSGAVDVPTGRPAFATIDMDGDGWLDLLITELPSDPSVGTTRWILHKGSSSGFGPPSDWALPAGFSPPGLLTLSGTTSTCLPDSPQATYAIVDVDGDGRRDLLVASSCEDEFLGTAYWHVYHGEVAGFSATKTSLMLPAGYSTYEFDRISSPSVSCGLLHQKSRYGLAARGGAGSRLDIVMTETCFDPDVGTSHWRVHPGSPAGFGVATSIALPAGYPARSFVQNASALDCENGASVASAVLRFDQDAHDDLLVTAKCGAPEIGTTKWLLHRGNAGGVDTPAEELKLPSRFGEGAFISTSRRAAACNAGQDLPGFTVTDIDGDGTLDLVLTDICSEAEIGSTIWLAYRTTCYP